MSLLPQLPSRRRGRLLALGALLALACGAVRAGGNAEVVCASPIVTDPSCTQGQIVDIAWSPPAIPVRWWMNGDGARSNTGQGGDPLDPAAVLSEVRAAFNGWEAVPETAIDFTFMGTTAEIDPGLDNTNLVVWSDTLLGTSTLAITQWAVLTVDIVVSSAVRDLDGDGQEDLDRGIYPDGTRLRAGTIVDADVILNSGAFDWSLDPDPTPDICDIRAVALHEAGHFHGLSHSAVLREPATMFAYFDTASSRQQEAARSLEWDDIAASARTYPVAGAGPSGVLSGRVVRSNNAGVVGAQVSAIDVATGRTVEAVFSNSGQKVGGGGAGAYRLDRLPPGTYRIAVDYLRRNGHFLSGWRWLNSEDTGYNVTVSQATLDPFVVSPELLSPVEGSGDDLSPSSAVSLAAGEQRALSNLIANTSFPAAPSGTTQLQLGDDTIIERIPIAFPFSFFGVPFTEFAAYANGYITFGTDLDLQFHEDGGNFFDLPRVAGLMRDLDPGFDQLGSGGPDGYVRLTSTTAETTWLALPEKVPARESGTTTPVPFGASTFTIGFDATGRIWIEYQRVSAPFGIAGLAAGNGFAGVREKFDFGRPRLVFENRPTLENAVPLSGLRVEFAPHAAGGYVASSPHWSAPEVAPPGGVGGLTIEHFELTRLAWPSAGTPRYNVYRGRAASLPGGVTPDAGSCIATAQGTQAFDVEEPARGEAFYYLVTAVREFGIEGSLGRNSAGQERLNAVPCRVR